ncbi:hypothetical protein IKH83_02375 [Candidatus Saccharibacteria bacterium]|nr:hypothetical protein [Candidatus Saccharibacteria bacterium]
MNKKETEAFKAKVYKVRNIIWAILAAGVVGVCIFVFAVVQSNPTYGNYDGGAFLVLISGIVAIQLAVLVGLISFILVKLKAKK